MCQSVLRASWVVPRDRLPAVETRSRSQAYEDWTTYAYLSRTGQSLATSAGAWRMRESVIKKTIAAEYNDGDKIVEALDLASQGLRVNPVKSKEPIYKAYKIKATTNPRQIKNWSEQFHECDWAVLAVIVNKLVVLDFDVKNGKQGF